MGIARGMIKLLMKEGKREAYSGHILTIGRQDIWSITIQDLQGWAQEMSFQLNPDMKIPPSDERYIKNGHITDIVLLLSLGFNHIDSLDHNNFEKCTVIHDLNTDISEKLYNKFDLIFDGGASEHIFNLPKVLENYNRMLKVGGRIIHALPSSNHVDHGFYMFSPALFWDYYLANKWEIKDSLFYKYSQKPDIDLWDIFDYSPGCLDRFSFGGFNKGLYGIFFVAKKTDKSIFNASVQQGLYLKKWDAALNAQNAELSATNSCKKVLARILPERLKLISRPLYAYILTKLPLRFHLKIIDRY